MPRNFMDDGPMIRTAHTQFHKETIKTWSQFVLSFIFSRSFPDNSLGSTIKRSKWSREFELQQKTTFKKESNREGGEHGKATPPCQENLERKSLVKKGSDSQPSVVPKSHGNLQGFGLRIPLRKLRSIPSLRDSVSRLSVNAMKLRSNLSVNRMLQSQLCDLNRIVLTVSRDRASNRGVEFSWNCVP
jgi:hypothetical protein